MTGASTLLGYWVAIHDPDDRVRSGEITAAMGDHHHLVKMQTGDKPPLFRLMSSDQLCGDDIMLFDTEAALHRYITWAQDDGEPRVVTMPRK